MATSEGIPSSIDIEFLELNDNPYFRQYLCYKENMHLFVFANLYAYRTTKYEINTTNAFADNPKNHVINPLNGNNKDYKMLLVNLSERSICSFH